MSLQEKIDLIRMRIQAASEAVRLLEEHKQAETPGFGEIVRPNWCKNQERVVLHDEEGVLAVYNRINGVLIKMNQRPDSSSYTRTGRNIAECLKTS